MVWSWGGVAALLVAGGVIFSGNDKPKDAPIVAPTQASITQANEVMPVVEQVLPVFTPNPELPPSTAEVKPHNEAVLRIEKAVDRVPVEATTLAPEQLTPSSICAHEASIFSRNNCEWRECEKPEFTALEECRHKQRKEDSFGG